MNARRTAILAVVAVVVVVAGCGSSSSTTSPTTTVSAAGKTTTAPGGIKNGPEVSPSGDIPDSQAYVAFSPPGSSFSVKVPEGWSRSAAGGVVTFTDKLNHIALSQATASAALTAADARRIEVPRLTRTTPGLKQARISAVRRQAGTAVKITYLAPSAADAVTGKLHTDAVERYVFFRNGKRAIVTLSGPQGADNVDPWRIVTDSLRFTR